MRRGREMVAEGADVVDVGGESTRPGAAAGTSRRGAPPRRASRRGARGRGSGLDRHDQGRRRSRRPFSRGDLVERRLVQPRGRRRRARRRLCRDAPQGHSCRHATRSSLRRRRRRGQRVTSSDESAKLARRASTEVYIDPGIGFGKTVRHNLQLLAALPELVATGIPVLVGTSRKGFIGHLGAGGSPDGRVGTSRRSGATTASKARLPRPCGRWRAARRMVRVHDVAATVQAARLFREAAA